MPESELRNKVSELRRLIKAVVPEFEERSLQGMVLFMYKSQLLVAYKQKRGSLLVQTAGRTPKERRASMKEYMTLTGNIRVRPGQPLPTAKLRAIVSARKKAIDHKPGRKSLFGAIPTTDAKNSRNAPRHERTAQRIRQAERRYPALKKITRHPKFGPWILPAATTLEVGGGLVLLLVVLPWLFSLLPDVTVPLPKVNLPDIPLPTINLPDWQLPDLPEWLSDILYWLGKTLPIWIAVGIALHAVRKNKSKDGK